MKRLTLSALAVLVGVATALVPGAAEARPRTASVIVFVSDRDSTAEAVNDDIYLYDTGTRRTSRLTTSEDGENVPILAPGGRYLAYGRFDGLEVCRLRSAAGGWTCSVTRRVAFVPGTPGRYAWTPDGRSLLYWGKSGSEPDNDIYRVDLAGLGPAVALTDEAPGEPELDELQPTVSPDGRFFVYTRDGDLWRRRIDGSHPVRLTSTPAPAVEFGAAYSPDGKHLAFHSNRRSASSPGTDDFDVYVMKPRPESQRNLPVDVTANVTAPGGGASRERFPRFSPDGTRIAFWWSVGGGQADLDSGEVYTIRADGTDPVNITANNPADPAVQTVGDIFPDWGRVRG